MAIVRVILRIKSVVFYFEILKKIKPELMVLYKFKYPHNTSQNPSQLAFIFYHLSVNHLGPYLVATTTLKKNLQVL